MLFQYIGVALDFLLFLTGIALYGIMEAGVAEPVRRPGDGRHQASAQFVFSLSTCLKNWESLFNAVFNWGVIADLKVKIRNLFYRAPVTAIQDAVSTNKKCSRNISFAVPCQ